MVKEAYCSFEVSKLLREKGFDEPCWVKYDNEGYLSFNRVGYINNEEPCDDFCALAPTHQMAMAWLREIHNIYLDINVRIIHWQWSGYIILIHTTDNNGFLYKKIPIVLKDNMSYEQVCEVALKYTLENLI